MCGQAQVNLLQHFKKLHITEPMSDMEGSFVQLKPSCVSMPKGLCSNKLGSCTSHSTCHLQLTAASCSLRHCVRPFSGRSVRTTRLLQFMEDMSLTSYHSCWYSLPDACKSKQSCFGKQAGWSKQVALDKGAGSEKEQGCILSRTGRLPPTRGRLV